MFNVADTKGEQLKESEAKAQQNATTVTVQGEEVKFIRYIPSCENTYLVLEVNVESMNCAGLSTEFKANSPVVGVAYIPLSANMSGSMWVPFTISNPSATKSFPYVKGGFIHVEIEIHSPISSAPPSPPSADIEEADALAKESAKAFR